MNYDKVKYYRLSEEGKAEALQKLEEILEKKGEIKLAYVFGSFIRRNAFRDIDIAVYSVPSLTLEEFLELGAEIELELGFQVDLAQLQDLNPKLRLKILMEGKPVIMRSKELHSRLISQSASEIQDYEISKRVLRLRDKPEESR
ncbi:MAG: nucleotidyltransferase domain-containing protein [Thaumarchaeota archaeon]|jgi:predicted nucleotidyltransferase|nr:nucleotidyltransferase domain-containing protein [Nitrososphaerota archaeon]